MGRRRKAHGWGPRGARLSGGLARGRLTRGSGGKKAEEVLVLLSFFLGVEIWDVVEFESCL
jgi:hypothetical protein